MPHADRSNVIRDAFLATLREKSASVESMIDLAATEPNEAARSLFLGLGQAGREIYLVRGVGIINIHIRSERPGWWNILKSVKTDLDSLADELGVKSYYVLLIGRDDHYIANGYIATDFASSPFARAPGIEKTKYSVNEKQHLDQSKLLLSVNKIANTLLHPL